MYKKGDFKMIAEKILWIFVAAVLIYAVYKALKILTGL